MEFEDKEMFGYAVAHPKMPDSMCWLGMAMNDGLRINDRRSSRWLSMADWEKAFVGMELPPMPQESKP